MKTLSEKETLEAGREFAEKIKNGGVVFLFGELGAGKTTFTKGVAEGLGITQRILSPTFTIVRQHILNPEQTFYHVDLYRVKDDPSLDSCQCPNRELNCGQYKFYGELRNGLNLGDRC